MNPIKEPMNSRRGDTRFKCVVFVRSVAQVRCFFFSLRNTAHNFAQLYAVERRDVRSGAQLSAGMCAVVRSGAQLSAGMCAVERSGAQGFVAQYQGALSV